MSTYLIINICIIVIPLILSFEKRLKFYKKIPALMISVLSVGVVFIIWDIIAVSRKDWWFNSDHISGITIFNLPYEEILFFVTVPYSIVFIHECLKYYLKDKVFKINFVFIILIVMFFLIMGFIFHDKYYTSTVFIFCGLLILIIGLSSSALTLSRVTIFTIIISYAPFLIVNYILTSFPVVIYNQDSILGIRAASIPIEDFVYSFSMISGWLFVYREAAAIRIKGFAFNN